MAPPAITGVPGVGSATATVGTEAWRRAGRATAGAGSVVRSPANKPPFALRALEGHPVFVVVNPTAQAGKVAAEIPLIRSAFWGTGVELSLFSENIPDATERARKIGQAFSIFKAQHHGSGPITVAVVGGDGTLDFVQSAITRTILGEGNGMDGNPVAVSLRLRGVVQFVYTKHGTASDLAVLVGASSTAPDIPGAIATGVPIGRLQPVLEGVGTVSHSVSFGYGAQMFKWVEEEKARTGKKTLWTYMKNIPKTIRVALSQGGFDVELAVDGRPVIDPKTRQTRFTVGAILGTSSPIIGGVIGAPGPFDHFRLILVQPTLPGVASVFEGLGRGLGNTIGVKIEDLLRKLPWVGNKVGDWARSVGVHRIGIDLTAPDRRSFTVPKHLNIAIQPGQEVSFAFFRRAKPNRLQRFLAKLGHRTLTPGAPLEVATIANGDVVPDMQKAVIKLPAHHVPVLATPDSMAVRFDRASALVEGRLPQTSDADLIQSRLGPDGQPKVVRSSQATTAVGRVTAVPVGGRPEGDIRRVSSPYLSVPRLNRVAQGLGLDPRQSHLLLSHYVGRQRIGDLAKIVEGTNGQPLSVEALRRLDMPSRFPQNTLYNRLNMQSGSLLLGLASMAVAPHVAESIGLDPVRDRELSYGFTVTGIEVSRQVGGKVLEVLDNHLAHRPYAFVTQEVAKVYRESFVRYTFHAPRNFPVDVWRASTYGLTVGDGLKGLGRLPVRATVAMGHGIFWGRLAELGLTKAGLGDSEKAVMAMGAAYTVPMFAQLLDTENKVYRFLYSKPMNVMAKVSGWAMVGDLTFSGMLRMAAGSETIALSHRASTLRETEGERSWLSDVTHFLAPTVGDFFDSHNLVGEEDEYMQKARSEATVQLEKIKEDYPAAMRKFAEVLKADPVEFWSQKITLTSLEQRIQLWLETASDTNNPEALVQGIIQAFPHDDLRPKEVVKSYVKIRAYELQHRLVAMTAGPFYAESFLANIFDPQGEVISRENLKMWIN